MPWVGGENTAAPEWASASETSDLPGRHELLDRVSIVMPVFNEEQWIETSLGAVLRQDYPAELTEVLVADNGSTDGTVDRIEQIKALHPERAIRVFRRSDRSRGAAMNLMCRHAKGDIVVRIDGHTEVARDYVRHCVSLLSSTGAHCVGGYIEAVGSTTIGRAIAVGQSSFLGNGGARFRGQPASQGLFVDTVPFGAWRRDTLLRAGAFVEDWSVNEDDEFSARLRDAGGRIYLHPAVRARYFVRSSLAAVADQYFAYGRLKAKVARAHPCQIRLRQVLPLLLVVSILASAALALVTSPAIAGAGPLIYAAAIAVAAANLAIRRKRLSYAWMLPAVFMTLHMSYGAGFLFGALGEMTTCISLRSSTDRRPTA